jgi:uncharacterized membrane protein
LQAPIGVTTTRLGVTIARPVEDVFAVLSDVENVPRWSRNTVEEKLTTPGPLGIGSRRRAVIRTFGGRTTVNEARMIGFEANRKMVVELIGAPMPARIVIDFIAVPAGTRLDWTVGFWPRGVLKPIAPLIGRLYGWAFQKDLENLRRLMERGEL